MSAPAVVVEVVEDVECPNCDGQGFTSQPLFGRHMVADSIDTVCGACHGTGLVAEDLTRVCEDCAGTYWVEVGGCAHRDLCDECGPVCKDCAREVEEDLVVDRFRVLEQIRERVTR